MNLFALAGLSCGVSCIILSAIALVFGKTKLHRLLLAFNVTVAIWGAGLFIAGIAKTESQALTGWKFAHVGAFYVAPLFYHLVSSFCERRRKPVLAFAYAQAIIFSLAVVGTDRIFSTMRPVYGLYYPELTLPYAAALAIYFYLVIKSFITLILYLPETRGQKYKQAVYMITGYLLGFLGATTALLPILGIEIIYPSGNFGVAIYTAVISYAILRHRFMDIHIMVKKSLVYSVSASFVTGIFIVLVFTMTNYLSELANVTSFAITTISALVISVLFHPLKMRVQTLADRLLYRSTYNHYETVQKISRELASTIDLPSVCRLIVDTVFETMKLKSIVLLSARDESYETVYRRVPPVRSGGSAALSPQAEQVSYCSVTTRVKPLGTQSSIVRLASEEHILVREEVFTRERYGHAQSIIDEFAPFDSEVALPVIIDNRVAYLIMLGGKLSGDVFSSEDIDMLVTIADQAAVSLKNAGLYDVLEQRVAERTSKLVEANNQLQQEVTERMRAEAELNNLHHDLELSVERRTRELENANRQLRTEISERQRVEEALKASREELKQQIRDLEKFYDIAVSREIKMIELKKKIKSLQTALEGCEIQAGGDMSLHNGTQEA